MNQKPQSNGPDPAVTDAIGRLSRSELSPLEETMFQAWAQANQIDDPDAPDAGMDYRNVYTKSGGRVLPPGELKKAAEKTSAIKAIMDAQQAHEEGSPIKAMMAQGMDPMALQQDPMAALEAHYATVPGAPSGGSIPQGVGPTGGSSEGGSY